MPKIAENKKVARLKQLRSAPLSHSLPAQFHSSPYLHLQLPGAVDGSESSEEDSSSERNSPVGSRPSLTTIRNLHEARWNEYHGHGVPPLDEKTIAERMIEKENPLKECVPTPPPSPQKAVEPVVPLSITVEAFDLAHPSGSPNSHTLLSPSMVSPNAPTVTEDSVVEIPQSFFKEQAKKVARQKAEPFNDLAGSSPLSDPSPSIEKKPNLFKKANQQKREVRSCCLVM